MYDIISTLFKMEKITQWKYTSSLKNIKTRYSKAGNSAARRRVQGVTPKRSFILVNKSKSTKEINRSIKTTEHTPSTSPISSNSFRIFKPQTKLYWEISQSPTPFDLKSKNFQKDVDELHKLLDYDGLEKKTKQLKKNFKLLTRKDMKKVESDREDLLEIQFEEKPPHPRASDYFKAIKKGNLEKLMSLMLHYPELAKEVDSTHQTGLHWACRRKNLEILKFLVTTNTNFAAKDIVGRRAEDIARQKKFTEIINYISAIRRRSGQHVSRVRTQFDDLTENPLQYLMRLNTRFSKIVITNK